MHDFVSVYFNLLFLCVGVLRSLVYKTQRGKLTEINILKVRIITVSSTFLIRFIR